MTEEEAKTKWCPFVREPQTVIHGTKVTVAGGCNADDLGARYPRLNCIAAACMAWRSTDNEAVGGAARHPSDASPVVFSAAGYCGLAGAAQ